MSQLEAKDLKHVSAYQPSVSGRGPLAGIQLRSPAKITFSSPHSSSSAIACSTSASLQIFCQSMLSSATAEEHVAVQGGLKGL